MVETEPNRVTTGVAAKRLGCSPHTVLTLIEAGELDAIRVGAWWRVSLKSIDAYLERNRSRSSAGGQR